MTLSDTIEYSVNGHIATLRLNNPAKHNSLGSAELHRIREVLAEVRQARDVRVLVVTGAGDKTFCAGAALNELGAGAISGDSFQAATDDLAALPIPTICALNGNVFGGGVELALSCDFRIGLHNTRMRVPAAAIGLCYPLSGINRFVERLGVNLAKRILVAAETFDANGMLKIGFVDRLVERDQLEAATAELAESIADLAPLAVKAMKDVLQQAAAGGIDQERSLVLSQACLDSEDLQEGFTAKKEGRAPRFLGQ